jgi:hypothetical protein
VSTFIELKQQAEQDILAHIPRPSSDSAEHFVADTTNHFVERGGAVLLAALRLWGEPRQETDADLRALIDSASARTLVIIARDLSPKVTVLINSMPACSSKALHTNLDAS